LALAGDDQRAALAACCAGLLHDAGAMRESRAAWQLALDAATDDRLRGRAWLGCAAACRVLDDLTAAADALDKAGRLAEASGDVETQARVHGLRGNLLFPQGDLDGCLSEHRASLQLARKAKSIALEAAAQGGIADAEFLRGRMLSALSRYGDCVELARRHGDARTEAANLPMVACARWYIGDAPGALADALQAIELALHIGHRRAEMIAQHAAYLAHTMLDAPAEALKHAERAVVLARQLDAPRFVAEGLAFRGEARVGLGDLDGLSDVREAVAIARATGLSFLGPAILGILAESTADAAERAAALAEGEALLRDNMVAHNHLLFRRAAIDTCLAAGDTDSALRHADALEAATRAEPLPSADFHVARARALARPMRDGPELDRLHARGLQLGQRRALVALEAALRMI
jgi:tetratricopeptide (TPR) repeat protein